MFFWHGFPNAFLGVEQAADGSRMLITRANPLTEGYGYLKPVYRDAVLEAAGRVARLGGAIQRRRRALSAPWDLDNVRPAAELAAVYYDALRKRGFFALGRFAWHRRPPPCAPSRGNEECEG
jgi:hypothetical protein